MAWKGRLVDRVLAGTSTRLRSRLLRRLALSLGVPSFAVPGKRGTFDGATTDVVHQMYSDRGDWAPRLQDVLLQVFRSGQGVYVDIGANIGLTVIPVATATRVSCLAFEAAPATFTLLQKNLIAAGATTVRAIHTALMDAPGKLELELSADNFGDSRLHVSTTFAQSHDSYGEARRPTVVISGQRFDALVTAGDLAVAPRFLKLDVQGAEVKVLRGMGALSTLFDYCYVEYWPYGLLRAGDDPEALLAFCRQFPYGIIFDEETTDVAALRFHPIEETLRRLTIPLDGSTTAHVDLLLSRTSTLESAEQR